jgi:hypothetical protein
MDTYSAAGHSTRDTCPRCGAALTGGVRWSRLNRVLRVRRPDAERPEPAADLDAGPVVESETESDAPPAAAAP